MHGNFIDEPTHANGDHGLVGTAGTNFTRNYYRGSAAQTTGYSTGGTDTISDTPGFTNEAADNFLPAAGSNMLDAVPDTDCETGLDYLNTTYGLDFREDILVNTRPSPALTDHDFGAYERQ